MTQLQTLIDRILKRVLKFDKELSLMFQLGTEVDYVFIAVLQVFLQARNQAVILLD
jgi:hypothetical protein